MLYILTEPRDDLGDPNLVLGSNGGADVLVLTSQSAAVLPAQVDNVSQLWGITPVEYLKALKMERSPSDELIFHEPIKNWVSQKDLPALLALADSQEPCASVAIGSSTVHDTRGLTLGDQALFMIESYQKGEYPPAPNSLPYDEARAKELKDWCREQIDKGPTRD
jgi:hypothetical protein